MNENTNYLTKEGYDNLVAELTRLKNEDLPAALARLKEAIGQGDISENAEYDTSIAEKELIESRIGEIEAFLSDVQIIEDDRSKSKDIRYGSKVKFEIVESKKAYEFTIVGSGEVDILGGTISFESPIGVALKGKQKGDVVRVRADSGRYDIKILEVN